MDKYGTLIIVSVLLGAVGRFYTLRVDYRQYPSFPHSFITHITLGFIAASLGALALPALLEGDFVAVTFLALAAQQFREIRNIERQTLAGIEETELVPRGKAYIEGIAKLFESRNYTAMISAFIATVTIHWIGLIPGIAITLGVILLLERMMVGPTIEKIAEVKEAEIVFKGNGMGVGDVIMMNLGEDEAIKAWKENGIALEINPKNDNARATLSNTGQRQAILHDLSMQLGIRLDVGLQQYSPIARLNIETGRVYVLIMPIEPDVPAAITAAKRVPVLESAQRKPLQSKAGKKAAD